MKTTEMWKLTDKIHQVKDVQLVLARAALVLHGHYPKWKTPKNVEFKQEMSLIRFYDVNRFSSTKPAFIPFGIQGYLGIFHVMKQVLSSCCLSASPVSRIPGCQRNALVMASQWNARLRPAMTTCQELTEPYASISGSNQLQHSSL